jgi:hypothetical protein
MAKKRDPNQALTQTKKALLMNALVRDKGMSFSQAQAATAKYMKRHG